MNTNISVFTGRITKTAEMKQLANQTLVTTFSIAVNERVHKQGTKDEYESRPNFIDIVVWGNYGKALLPSLTKGREVTITCRLHQDRWEKDGHKYSKIAFYADNIEVQREPKNTVAEAESNASSIPNIDPQFEPMADSEEVF